MVSSMDGFCGEIEYESENGRVHSDVCWHDYSKEPDEGHRELLHRYLDEWLDHAKGTGYFWVGNPPELFWRDYHPLADETTESEKEEGE